MKRRGLYTIWVFKGEDFKPRRFKIPSFLIRFFTPIFLVIIITFPFITYDYVKKRLLLEHLKKEIRSQRQVISSIQKEVELFRKRLAELQEFNRKIRIIANLEPEEEGFLGVGGVEGQGIERYLNRGERIRRDLVNLNLEAELCRHSSEFLYHALQGKKKQLACTPSIWPVRGWVTSRFGYRTDPFTGLRRFHRGIDIANRRGTPVIAPADGLVARIYRDATLGLVLVINHGYGIITRYGHLHKVLVRVGQRVKRGQRIALLGNSGRSTGPHLHYEVRLNGVPVNPFRYILN